MGIPVLSYVVICLGCCVPDHILQIPTFSNLSNPRNQSFPNSMFQEKKYEWESGLCGVFPFKTSSFVETHCHCCWSPYKTFFSCKTRSFSFKRFSLKSFFLMKRRASTSGEDHVGAPVLRQISSPIQEMFCYSSFELAKLYQTQFAEFSIRKSFWNATKWKIP